MHEWLRQQLGEQIKGWDETVLGFIERFRLESGEASTIGLYAVAREGDSVLEPPIALFDLPVERRRQLELKNRSAAHLEKVLVTND